MATHPPQPLQLDQHAAERFHEHQLGIHRQTDRLFAALMFFQWSGLILAARWIAPRTWIGASDHLRQDFAVSVVLGAVLTLTVVCLALLRPGRGTTRHVIAISQMLMTGLLIHNLGGRIETHFYVFGSLAFLAFYRDWRVLVSATVVTGLDHAIRGTWWPQSIFGEPSASPWRWVEHVGLLSFADVFLIRSCLLSVREMKDIAAKRAELESTNEIIESEVRRQTAELREARHVAETANRAKTVLLENVSHELRTPMNGIMGMTELALETTLTPQQRQYLSEVRNSSESLLSRINDILDFAAIESGRMNLVRADFRLRQSLDEALGGLRRQAEEKGLSLRWEVDEGVPDALHGDVRRLMRLIGTLVDNGIKFTPQGQVDVRVTTDPADDDDVLLHVQVADTGVGIPPEKLASVFQPFEQVDASSKRQFGGTGLGLTIGNQLAQHLGGRLWAESVVGQGSTFHFTALLPRATESDFSRDPVQPAVPVTNSTAIPSQLRILLAEDNLVNQAYAERILKQRGHTVVTAGDGGQAIEAWQREAFQLVLMDLQMPGVDGFEATAAIRAGDANSGRHTPIIALTAHADLQQCLDAGMDGYVAKPIRPSELFSEISRVVGVELPAAAGPEPERAPQETVLLFDKDQLLERVNHDSEFLAELVELFNQDSPMLLEQLRTAIADRDATALARAAHAFKGMVGNFCAPACTRMAYELEMIGKEGALDEAKQGYDVLESEAQRLKDALNDMLAES